MESQFDTNALRRYEGLKAGIAGIDPLYQQIAAGLIGLIESGELQAGDRIPSERDLSRFLGVNRMTLREALRLLEVQGFLARRQGDGTYIADRKFEREAGELFSFSRGMRKRGLLPGALVLQIVRMPADTTIAEALDLEADEDVYYFQRIRSLNEVPVMLEKFWLSAVRFTELPDYDLEKRFVYDILEEDFGLTVTRARLSLEAVVATRYEAEMLQIEVGAPLMLEQRLSFDGSGRPIEFGRDLYRGDRFRFTTEMAPVENYQGDFI